MTLRDFTFIYYHFYLVFKEMSVQEIWPFKELTYLVFIAELCQNFL